jgi:AcrR family transcriptional regulator
METGKTKVNREIILEKTLILLDKRNGIRNVTLRDIAKEIGCAHTNLYNYYISLDEIFWEALGKVLNKMMEYAGSGLTTDGNHTGEAIKQMLGKLIDFYIEHPGWFSLVWMDTLSGTPSSAVEEILQKPSIGFTKLLRADNTFLAEDKARNIGEILMKYLLGELCTWINKRSFVEDKELIKKKILTNIEILYTALQY